MWEDVHNVFTSFIESFQNKARSVLYFHYKDFAGTVRWLQLWWLQRLWMSLWTRMCWQPQVMEMQWLMWQSLSLWDSCPFSLSFFPFCFLQSPALAKSDESVAVFKLYVAHLIILTLLQHYNNLLAWAMQSCMYEYIRVMHRHEAYQEDGCCWMFMFHQCGAFTLDKKQAFTSSSFRQQVEILLMANKIE